MQRRTALAALGGIPLIARAQSLPTDVDDSAANLMAVLRESIGGKSRPQETMEFIGRFKITLQDGKEAEIEAAHYAYLGDMHIRFAFDGERMMRNARPADLERLKLSPDAALEVATANLRRVYGAPRVEPFTAGVQQVQSKSPDLISSYFLDKAFWRELEARHPQGFVAGVPVRGGLVFAPAADTAAVDVLRRGIGRLHSSGGRMRVSSGLYLFRGGAWTVFQEPSPTPP